MTQMRVRKLFAVLLVAGVATMAGRANADGGGTTGCDTCCSCERDECRSSCLYSFPPGDPVLDQCWASCSNGYYSCLTLKLQLCIT